MAYTPHTRGVDEHEAVAAALGGHFDSISVGAWLIGNDLAIFSEKTIDQTSTTHSRKSPTPNRCRRMQADRLQVQAAVPRWHQPCLSGSTRLHCSACRTGTAAALESHPIPRCVCAVLQASFPIAKFRAVILPIPSSAFPQSRPPDWHHPLMGLVPEGGTEQRTYCFLVSSPLARRVLRMAPFGGVRLGACSITSPSIVRPSSTSTPAFASRWW